MVNSGMDQGGKTRDAILAGVGFISGVAASLLLKKVWYHYKVGRGRFSSVNRPIAGAREARELPQGKHDIQLYSMATPNGQKVTILLEELKVPYDAYRVDIMKGVQFTSGFVNVNPNSKIPAMLDKNADGGKAVNIFETGSILLYLAEKYDKEGKFLPKDRSARTEVLNWLFFNVGAAPFFGQFGHFLRYAPIHIQYGIDRYTMETRRILDVLEKRLESREYLAADSYSIADIAWYPWVNCIISPTGYNAADTVHFHENCKHVAQWLDRIKGRPAVQSGVLVNSSEQPEKHST